MVSDIVHLSFSLRAAARQNERPECLLPGILRYSMIILSALRFVNQPERGKCRPLQEKTANSLTSGRRRAIIRVQQQAFALFSPAYQSDHDARHGRLFSFAGLPASREARMRRRMRRISQAEGSAWLSPPSGQIPGWNGVKPAATQWPTVSRRQGRLNHIRQLASRKKQPLLTSGREDARI